MRPQASLLIGLERSERSLWPYMVINSIEHLDVQRQQLKQEAYSGLLSADPGHCYLAYGHAVTQLPGAAGPLLCATLRFPGNRGRGLRLADELPRFGQDLRGMGE